MRRGGRLPAGYFSVATLLAICRPSSSKGDHAEIKLVEKLQNPYRPDIDGLRAVAVSLVVLYHAFPNQLPGGYVGVDIFFVISGYLITQILARELQEGTFSIARFYERRVRRIFPALLVVLIAVILAGGALFLPLEYQQLGLDAFAAAAFVSNIASLMHSGYFDVASSSKPLLHLWSLGIEEQFYLAWPLILLFIHRLRQPAGLAVAILALLSFLANIWLIGTFPIATFYLPFTRAWELLAGALLALLPNERSSQATANVLSIAGILLIGAAAWLLNSKEPFSGMVGVATGGGNLPDRFLFRCTVKQNRPRKSWVRCSRSDQLSVISLALAATGFWRQRDRKKH